MPRVCDPSPLAITVGGVQITQFLFFVKLSFDQFSYSQVDSTGQYHFQTPHEQTSALLDPLVPSDARELYGTTVLVPQLVGSYF